MCKNLHESVYFKELHDEQEYYSPTIYRTGAAVVSTTASNNNDNNNYYYYYWELGVINKGPEKLISEMSSTSNSRKFKIQHY